MLHQTAEKTILGLSISSLMETLNIHSKITGLEVLIVKHYEFMEIVP